MCRDVLQQCYPTGSLGEDDLERAAGGSKTLCETAGSCGSGRQGAICDGELFIEARGVFGGVSHRWRGVVGSGQALQRVIWSATPTLWLPGDRADAHSLPCACRPLTRQGVLYRRGGSLTCGSMGRRCYRPDTGLDNPELSTVCAQRVRWGPLGIRGVSLVGVSQPEGGYTVTVTVEHCTLHVL